MSATLPKVVALLPAYNAERFIARTLDSLAAQTWPNFEIIIADDASTDGTLAIIEAFAASRPHVQVIARERNLGWVANCNALMAEARGDMMLFAFHDDTIAPTYVERLATALVAHPDAILSYSDIDLTAADGDHTQPRFTALDIAAGPLRRGLIMAGMPPYWWVPNRGVFRSKAFAAIGGIHRNAAGEFSADWTWLLHMALLGRFIRVPQVLAHKYFQKTSLSPNWAFSRAQRGALRRAGIREVLESDTPLQVKLPVALYLALNLSRLRFLVGRLLRSFRRDRP